MEEGYGGPVWHASVASMIEGLSPATLQDGAFATLFGVGDASLGEWEEWTGRAYHVRRRLNEGESRAIGPVIDVRGGAEGARRVACMKPYMPAGVPLGEW